MAHPGGLTLGFARHLVIQHTQIFARLPVEVSAHEVVYFLLGLRVSVLKLVQERVLDVEAVRKHHVCNNADNDHYM